MNMYVSERLNSHSDAAARVQMDLAGVATTPVTNKEETIFENGHTRVTRITIPRGGRIALRREPETVMQWFVTQGRARISIGHMVKVIWKGDTAFVPPGKVHGLENPGSQELILTEVRQHR